MEFWTDWFSHAAYTGGPYSEAIDRSTADHDLMTLRGGMRAALVSRPDGHRFLVEERR
jgi:hypothetical protein